MLKGVKELIGGDVFSRGERLGALDDVYIDGECWQVRYLVIDAGEGLEQRHLLVSTGCVDAHSADGIQVALSRVQLEAGAGVWPARAASAWLDFTRVHSGCDLVGFRLQAEDGAAGRVADLLLDEQEWSIDYLVVDVAQAGGVHQILLPLDWVAAIEPGARRVYLRCTLEELRASPRIDV